MQEQYLKILRKLEGTAKALETAAMAGAQFYANGTAAERPGVFKHFTAGNQARYAWAPLSHKYAMEKAGGIFKTSPGAGLYISAEGRRHIAGLMQARDEDLKQQLAGVGKDDKHLRKAVRASVNAKHAPHIQAAIKWHTQGRVGAKLDQHQTHLPQFDRALGLVIRGENLPMLVRTGRMRDAVTTLQHAIRQERDTAFITFANLPDYANYHQTGTSKMPRRSPIDPNELDAVEIHAAIQRHLDARLGTGSPAVPQTANAIPGAARTTV